MKIRFTCENDKMNIQLNKEYNLFTIESLNELLNDETKFIGIKRIYVDCTQLESIDSFGGEIFLLKKRYDVDEIKFIGLKKVFHSIFNEFSQQFFGNNIKIASL